MSDQLHEPLHDLLAEVPSYVVPDARAAWSAGARRRTRRRLAVTACVLVLVALAGAAVSMLPRSRPLQPATGGDGSSAGYPARIDAPLWLRDLPSDGVRRVAGALERSDGSWLAVSPAGHLWRIPGADGRHPVTVSPDGRRLAYLDERPGQELTVLELDDGSSSTFSVGARGRSGDGSGYEPWVQAPHTPSLWSPDSQRLLVPVLPAAGNADRGVVALVWRPGSGAHPVRLPASLHHVVAAGWVDQDRLAWVAWQPGSGYPVARAQLVVTDLRGRVLRRTELALSGDTGDLDPTSVSLAPGGEQLAVGADHGLDGVSVRFLDTRTGERRATMPAVWDAAPGCPPSWADTLLVPTTHSVRDAALVSVNGGVRVLADPRLGVTCSTWTWSALAGERHEGLGGTLFGDSTSWLSWHWREVGAGLAATALVAGLLAGALVVRRRRVSG